MKKNVFMTAIVALTLASCGSTKVAGEMAALDGEWTIVEVEGNKINKADGDEEPFLGFNSKESRLYGNTGCNLLTGTLKADASKGEIDFSQTGSTRMMCANMKTERMVLDALNKSTKFTVDGKNKMTLNDKKGNIVVVLQKRK